LSDGLRLFDPRLVAAGGGGLLQRLHLQPVIARDLSHQRDRLRPLRAVRAVDLDQLFAVRREQRQHHVNASLIDHHP
jgi:hypothetical protein